MDEYEASMFLTEISQEHRTDSIKSLHNILKNNKGKCPFSDCYEISRGLAVALFEKEIDVKVIGLNFACDFISCLEERDDNCIQVLIPAILTCLQDSRSGVQLTALKTLKMCLKMTKDFHSSLSKIISEGIESQNLKISRMVISKIHLIIGDYKKDSSLTPLVKALFTQLSNKSMQQVSFEALKKLKNIAGERMFADWCSDVEENSMKIFQHLSGNIKSSCSIEFLMKDRDSAKTKDYDLELFESCNITSEGSQPNQSLKFGFLSKEDYNVLMNCNNCYEKEDELEKLKKSVESSHFDRSQLHYFSDFIDFLLHFHDTNNMRVDAICFEIIGTLISKFGQKLRPHLRFLMMNIFPHLCSAVPPLKKEIVETIMRMFEDVSYKDSCSYVLEFFNHSRSKQRQEALNVLIFAFSKFPLEKFNLRQIIPGILNMLLDQRRSVRHSAMECTALLASLLGPDQPVLDHYLERIESSPSGIGVTEAVNDRLKIGKVPRCRPDGTVEYVAISREVGRSVLEWILSANAQSDGLGRSFSTDGILNQQSIIRDPHSSHHASQRRDRDPRVNLNNAENGPRLNGMLPISSSFSSSSGIESPLLPMDHQMSSGRNSMGRKYHSAGIVDRFHSGDSACGTDEVVPFNFNQSCHTPSSLSESISSIVSSATFPDTRKKFSARKNVMRMFERLEQKEIETKKLSRDKVEEERFAQSRRCPLKAITDHRMMLNMNLGPENKSGETRTKVFESGSWNEQNDVDDDDDDDGGGGGDLQDKNNNQMKASSNAKSQQRPSTPNQKSFPGRSEYPLDLFIKDQNRLDINYGNNQNNSSNMQSRRISVVQIEMPDSWSNKSAENKEMPNISKPNKTLKTRQALAKKKEQLRENEETRREEPAGRMPPIEDLIHVLNTDDWKSEVASLDKIGEMCQTSPHLITPHLLLVVQAVVKEVSNLRSNVAVSAMKCLSELFKNLQSSMEPVLDMSIGELLNRTGHTNNFIRQKALSCLYDVIQNVSFSKSLNAILSHGSNNKNVAIKNATSHLVLNICEILGPQGVFSAKQKDLTGKIIVAASQFLTDNSPEVRANGRRVLMNLKHHDMFEQVIRQFVPQEIIARSLEPILRGNDMKSEFEITTPMSAQQRVTTINRNSSIKHSRYHSAGNLCGGGGDDKDIPMTTGQMSNLKLKKERHVRMDETVLENILKLSQDLDANNYRERWAGIDALRRIIIFEGKISAVATHINKIFDKYVSCLRDPNHKVTVHALQTLKELLPYLAPHMSHVVPMTVSTVSMNLASNNKEVLEAACSILDVITQVIDPSVLLPSFVAAAMNANARYKTEMVDRVSDLVRQVGPQRQKIVSLHVLPLLWHLLSSMTTRGSNSASQTRRATARLASDLRDLLGDNLMSSASMNSKVSTSMKELLLELLQGDYNDVM